MKAEVNKAIRGKNSRIEVTLDSGPVVGLTMEAYAPELAMHIAHAINGHGSLLDLMGSNLLAGMAQEHTKLKAELGAARLALLTPIDDCHTGKAMARRPSGEQGDPIPIEYGDRVLIANKARTKYWAFTGQGLLDLLQQGRDDADALKAAKDEVEHLTSVQSVQDSLHAEEMAGMKRALAQAEGDVAQLRGFGHHDRETIRKLRAELTNTQSQVKPSALELALESAVVKAIAKHLTVSAP